MGKNSQRYFAGLRGGNIEKFIIFSFFAFRITFFIAAWFVGIFLIPKTMFLGPVPWANFDGVHYLTIGSYGYFQYEQAFFPLFPMLIHVLGAVVGWNYLLGGLILVHTSFLISLILFWKLMSIDFDRKTIKWAILFLLFFPTSFFFLNLYTESFFLMLVLGSFYCARKKKWFLAGLLGAFASATRFVGIFLLPALLFEYLYQCGGVKKIKPQVAFLLIIPTGLLSYMVYLWERYGDFLLFFHTQPYFGAHRSGNEIILLPQVIYRYLRIFTTVSWSSYDVKIAFLEFSIFIFALIVLALNYKKIRLSYLIFSFFVILVPPLTGTLSSIPRYVVVAFPLFISFALITNTTIKYALFIFFFVLFLLLSGIFSNGYFVA